ncbi:MAG: cadherin-like beta sandwich domain-containing protein, partial [Clostridiales bacterium]|nr:cadherin-like beta sandwich domain-containing protein [Clostridiales bacterium]
VFVPYSISTVYISTIRYDNTSSVSINGDTGTARSISISTGNNTINVQVTAANGNVKTYTVQVRRATSSANNESNLSDLVLRSGSSGSNTVNLDPSFESGITSYTAYMADGITFCRFVPTISDSDARAIVAGYVTTSGSVSNSVSLAQGKNIITVRVIAADCTTATDYNITIIRERSKFFVPIGTPDQEAIPIYTAEDLDNARNKLDGSYVLMNDIDLAEWGEWEPIGDASNWYNKDNYYYNSFKGTFDGQGHVIRNLTISGYTDSTYSGLFGFSEGASIKNLGLEDINVDITSSAANMRLYVGGISGLSSEAIINNCYTTGIISTVYAFPADHNNDGHDGFYDIISVGGICGLSNITEIYNCYNQANISSSSSFTKNPPGFRVSTYSYVGGICGSGRGSDGIIISSCSNTGNISVISDYEARAGGIIGDINRAAAITSSYNAGNISAFCPNSGARAGGIYGCGFAYYSKSIIIKNCYNAGSISAKAPNFSAYAGGIGADTIASMSDDPRDYGYAEITSCFVLSGEIIAEADIDYPRESNLVSFDWGGNVHKINNLALTGIQGNAIDDATRRISQSEAKEQATYEELGWDFGGIWQMVEGYKYPQLYGLPLDEPEHISADSTLASLTISAGTLYPAFNPYFTNYTATVVNSVSSISVNATANNSKATVLGAGIKSLDVGFNTIILTVTAEDGTTTRTYTIDVNRAIDSAGSVSSSGGATSYTLTFDSNGGSMITSQKVGAGSKITKPANPTKDGFKFIGWFSDAALTKEYDFNATVSSSLTLYAKWEEIAEVKMETWQNPFTDVNSGNWFYENVKYVVTKGLFNGTGPTTFAPQSTMTRAMLFTVLARLAGVNTEGGATWYSLALDWAVKEGLTDGSNPQNPVTREQIVTILWRYADKPAGEGNLKVFPDAASASEWAVGAFEWAIGTGIINGSGGNLLPKGMATRAEVAAILHRFAELPK